MKSTMAALILLLCVCMTSVAALGADDREKNKAVARRVFEEIFNQGKFQVADEIYSKDFVNHAVHRDVGLKEDQDAARGWKPVFPDLKMTVLREVAEGDLVTVLWTGSGTNTARGMDCQLPAKRLTDAASRSGGS